MPVNIYFDDPIASALLNAGTSYFNAKHDIATQKHYEELAKRKKRQRTTAIVGTAAAGALTGGIAAAALAPSVAATAGAAGYGLGAVGGEAAGAGIGGIATGALLGANVGAGLGGTLATGEAAPLMNSIGDLTQYAVRHNELAQGRNFQREMFGQETNRMRDMEQLRTNENIRQAQEMLPLQETGMTASQLQELSNAQGEYQSTVGGGPQAGAPLNLPIPGASATAFGPGAMAPLQRGGMGPPAPPSSPIDAPGPSPIPGMEKIWGPQQLKQLSALEKQRIATIDNPEWVSANGPEARELQRQALARQFSSIRATTVPARPKPMFVDQNGQSKPIPLGVADMGNFYTVRQPDGSTDFRAKTKAEEAPSEVPVILDNGNILKMTPNSAQIHKIDDNTQVGISVDSSGTPHFTKIESGGGAKPKKFNPAERAAALVKPPQLDEDGNVTKQGVDATHAAQQVVEEQQAMFISELMVKSPKTVSPEELKDITDRIEEAYGDDPNGIPTPVMDQLRRFFPNMRPLMR